MNFYVKSTENVSRICTHSKCNPIATDNGFVFTSQSSMLTLWANDETTVIRTEHKSPISTVCHSSADYPYVCSCSDDKVIIWKVSDFQKEISQDENPQSRGLLVGVELGAITDCSISCNNVWLALCRTNDVWVVRLEHESGILCAVAHHASLEPAGNPPSFCRFSPIIPNLLVTADDSNTFKVWDADAGMMKQRTSVGAWHCISFCEFVSQGSYHGSLLVGTNRGMLHLFTVSLQRPPRSFGKITTATPMYSSVTVIPTCDNDILGCYTGDDVSRKSSRGEDSPSGNFLSNHQITWRAIETQIAGGSFSCPGPAPDDSCEAGCIILSALVVDGDPRVSSLSSEPLPVHQDSTVDAILAPSPLLFVCTNQGMAVYDCNAWDCLAVRPYADLLSKAASDATSPCLVSGAVLGGRSPEGVLCLLSGWMCSAPGAPGSPPPGPGPGPSTFLIRVGCRRKDPVKPVLSFLAMSSVSARSPLRAQFSKPAVDAVTSAYGRPSRGHSKGRVLQVPPPRPVKSSGYGAPPPPRQRFVPLINHPRAPPVPPRTTPSGRVGGILARVDSTAMAMRSWTPPLRQTSKLSVWGDFGTAVRLASSGDGLSLACSCGPGVLSVMRWARPNVDDCTRIPGHDARITSLCFSADSAWLMSASSDGRTKVWDWRERRCALDIDANPSGKMKTRGGRGKIAARGHAVTQAAFYYLDRFILQAVGNVVELYCHRLHEQQDVKHGHGVGVKGWRRVQRMAFPTQQVTCFLAPNTFYSNLMVVGCASRSLHVFDVDAQRVSVEVLDAHPRAPHCLALATPSPALSSGAGAADLFVSMAVCDGAKLWDLRQARCVQKFVRHLNRAHACGVALSACCRYLAVGSEDKCVYLYDTRKSCDYVDKLYGLNEVVLDVVWNCSTPQLGASALNNCVALYST